MSPQLSRRVRRLSVAGLAAGAVCALAPALPAQAGGAVHARSTLASGVLGPVPVHGAAPGSERAGGSGPVPGFGVDAGAGAADSAVAAPAVSAPAVAARRTPPLDGFRLAHLPAGLGTPSDFRYEWGGVTFHARDWESRHGDGWRVDLTAETLRGHRLTTLTALRGYLTDYLQPDPDSWRLTRARVGSHPALRTDDRVFWLVRPGLAVSISIDPTRYGVAELLRTARGVREER